MYENNTALTKADLEKYAGEVGLNVAKLKQDWDDAKIKADIAEDMKVGTAVGASGTPTFFINGHELVGAQEASAFDKIIDDEIKAADALIKKGTPLKDVYGKRIEMAAAEAPAPSAPSAPAEPEGKFDVHVGDAPVKGPSSARVTLVAFSDFQCPFCSRAVPTVKQLETDYPGKLRIAFKEFPLPFHDHAHLAAEAALAANEQGKFWQMHDKLFANQQALDRPALEKYAQELGLDMAKFKAALDSQSHKPEVDADAKMAADEGIQGTPAFVINGYFVNGAQPYDKFKQALDKGHGGFPSGTRKKLEAARPYLDIAPPVVRTATDVPLPDDLDGAGVLPAAPPDPELLAEMGAALGLGSSLSRFRSVVTK